MLNSSPLKNDAWKNPFLLGARYIWHLLPSLQETSPYPTKRESRKIIDSELPANSRGYVIVPRRVHSLKLTWPSLKETSIPTIQEGTPGLSPYNAMWVRATDQLRVRRTFQLPEETFCLLGAPENRVAWN